MAFPLFLRQTVRRLSRERGFTGTALVTLALCLGANLTIFAVVDSILLRPLPFPDADRLVGVFNTYPKAGVLNDGASVTNYYERRGRIAGFKEVAIYREGTAIIGDTGSTDREDVTRVSPDFFSTLGVRLVLGRAFREEETGYETDNVAILTDACWRQRFNADPGVLGRSIRIDGEQRTIIGVLPADFRFLSSRARIYFPLSSSLERRMPDQRHSGSSTHMIARLKPGTTLCEAQSQVDAHNAAVEKDSPFAKMMSDAGFRSLVVPLHADHVASIRPTLLLMQAGVLFLLLIGAVNLVNLLLIRASGRVKELATRRAMGATARHVVMEVMAETTVLTLTGGLLGLVVGAGGITLLMALGANQLPLGAHIAFDARLALVAVAGAIVMGIAIGTPVVWHNLRGHLATALQSESRGGTPSRAAQRVRYGFIVAQIALGFVLLAGAGLIWLSLKQVMAVSPGFRPDHVLSGQLSLSYDEAGFLSFTERLLQELGRQPGVRSVGIATNVPLSGDTQKSAVTVKGLFRQPGESPRGHYAHGITGDYFGALGFSLKEGRLLTAADSRREELVCVIDEDFARRYWPQGNAIGQRLFQGPEEGKDDAAFTVVGVVGAAKQAELTEVEGQGAVYFPYRHFVRDGSIFVVARTALRPESLATTLQDIVRRINPELPVTDVRSMDTRVADSLVARRSPALLSAIFAAVALLLTGIGTYGVLSYAVAQRRREIAMRMALGALPQQIRGQFLSLGLRLLAAGITAGVLGAWISGRAMQSVLFEVPTFHPTTLLGTTIVISVVTLVACLLPSHRAACISPIEALAEK